MGETQKNLAGGREYQRFAAQIALPKLLSGEAIWLALQRAVDDLVRLAPQDHDVLVCVGDVSIDKIEFIEPHTFLFKGFGQNGHRTALIIHFSQLAARIVYLPKRGPSRVITGFAPEKSA
jgi:hypothetical protein